MAPQCIVADILLITKKRGSETTFVASLPPHSVTGLLDKLCFFRDIVWSVGDLDDNKLLLVE